MWKGANSYEMRSLNITIRGQYHPFRNDPEYLSLSTVLFWRHLIPLTAEKSEIIQPDGYHFPYHRNLESFDSGEVRYLGQVPFFVLRGICSRSAT